MTDFEAGIRHWLQEFVVAQNICPFAKLPLEQDRIRITVEDSEEEEKITVAVLQELEILNTQDRQQVETSLLVLPGASADFVEFWSFLGWVEEVIEQAELDGIVQVVGFHPSFQFAESEPDDAGNFTNRSPWPMLHFLREISISEVVAYHPDIASIPTRNATYLRQIGATVLRQQLTAYK